MKKAVGALIVIDVQNDFCPGGALAVPGGDQVIAPLNRAIEHAKANGWLVVASRDWHPNHTIHFKEFGGLRPVHCVQNTIGAQFHPSLRLPDTATIVSKGMGNTDDGYSLFDGVKLRKNDWPLSPGVILSNCHEVYVGGLATDYCVKATALDATKHGFKTYVILDACRAVNINDPNSPIRNTSSAKEIIESLRVGDVEPSDEVIAIEEMRRAGVVFTTTEEVLKGGLDV